MPCYEYKVVPAPAKGLKGKGVKGPHARFSNALEHLMNELAAEGWEYQRAETLPSIERSGLTGSTTEWRNVLVFRRPNQEDADAFAPELLPPPAAVAAAAATVAAIPDPQEEQPAPEAPEEPAATPQETPEEDVAETGEEASDEAEENAPSVTLQAVQNAAKSDT